MSKGKLIGVGNTAEIYEWQNDKVIKLFKSFYPKNSIEKEFINAQEISNYNFSKPKAYQIIEHENRFGIIYDKVQGVSLLSWLIETNDIETCARHMSKLHKKILKCKVSADNTNIISYKEFLYENIVHTQKLKGDILSALNLLPEGDTLCHGDFHPGNIFIDKGEEILIDFMNICKGHYLYDIARTIYLIEYTPVPNDVDNINVIKMLKRELGKTYLKELGIQRNEIEKFIDVIKVARLGECPEEKYNELN